MELDSNNDSIFYDFVYFQKSITFCFYIILILFYDLLYSNYCYNNYYMNFPEYKKYTISRFSGCYILQ